MDIIDLYRSLYEPDEENSYDEPETIKNFNIKENKKMIDVSDYIKKTIKKEIFKESDLMNKAARQVLSEMKTKYVDIKEDIDTKVQFKILNKMKSERIKDIEIYEKSNNEAGMKILSKEKSELNVIEELLNQIKDEMPKQLTNYEIVELINKNQLNNIGDCMKFFNKNYPDQDKKMINQVFKNIKEDK